MKKKKKNTEVPYREAVIYTSKFITYTEDGTVLIAEQVRDEAKNQLEISLDLIPNFLSGEKRYIDYKIDYFLKIKEGIITDDDDYEKVEKYNNVFYEIPKNNDDSATIIIEHDKLNESWNVSVNNITSSLNQFNLFVTKKHNLNFLYASHTVNFNSKNKVELKFLNSLENNFDGISIFTMRKFNSYSLRKLNV